MHLALLIYGSLSTPSGGYLYDRKLVEYLERQGDRVEIVALPWRDYARHLGDNFSAELRRRLQALQVDILVQDELNHPSLFRINRSLKDRAHYPIVSIVHHLRSSEARPSWQNRLYGWVERGYLESLDGLIFNSQTTRRAVQGQLGQRACPPWVVAYPGGDRLGSGITEEEIERRARQPGPLKLAFAGNLIPRKNLHMLVDALHRLPGGAWELRVAGSDNADRAYAQAVQRQVARLGLEGRVRFLGHLPEEDLAGLLRASHLLAVPSSYEGFGIAYLEGMSFGLPAIASTAGAAGEIITHGENGFLVDPGDPGALAACLGALIEDRTRLAGMGRAALRRFQGHPTWDQSAAEIRAFLQTLVSSWAPKGSSRIPRMTE